MWFFIRELILVGTEIFFLSISKQFAWLFSDQKRLLVLKLFFDLKLTCVFIQKRSKLKNTTNVTGKYSNLFK